MPRRIGERRAHALLLVLAPCLTGLLVSASLALAAPAGNSSSSKTIGLAITDWRYALVETPDAKEECAAGLQPGEATQFTAQKDYLEHIKKFGGGYGNRGPIGEMANYNPLSVEDPLPWKELSTKTGYGVNLDGTPDGHATAKTCQHEKFTSAEGEKVDNQMARVVGCVQGYRTSGMVIETYANEIVVLSAVNRHLIEISGVDDEMNDPSVDVTIYKGIDRLVRTADGNGYVPFLSQRVDDRFPQYQLKTHGKIVDGVLITDPIPLALMPISQARHMGDRQFRDMTLRLKLTPDGAEGLLSGYEDLAKWWNVQSKEVVSELGKFSPSGLYKAAHRYADGDPDPKTGQCTSISTTYKLKAVRVMIVPGHAKPSEIAMAPK